MVMLHAAETTDIAVDRIFREQTDPGTHEVNAATVVDAIREWLGEDRARVTETIIVDVARGLKNAYLKRHRSKMIAGQLSLFDPKYLLPLGSGRLVWADFASRVQVEEWRAVLVKAHERTRKTYDERIRQIDERLDRWGTFRTWGELERVSYGWTEADMSYDDDADDDDDE